jgi:hypothetical protein
MAPERPLTRMAIEILCPCLVWELALFCAAPQVPHLRHQYLKICKLATFPNVFIINTYKIADQLILNSPTVLEQVPTPPHAEGRGAVSISTSTMAKGTICPC